MASYDYGYPYCETCNLMRECNKCTDPSDWAILRKRQFLNTLRLTRRYDIGGSIETKCISTEEAEKDDLAYRLLKAKALYEVYEASRLDKMRERYYAQSRKHSV
jgi:hypothetical protein